MAKVTLDEKRLERLRAQLQGRAATASPLPEKSADQQSSPKEVVTQSAAVESTQYLRRDLTKIIVMATLAIAFQLALYFSMTSHILNINL